jgi:Leucine-rich repeat (LRR) protein
MRVSEVIWRHIEYVFACALVCCFAVAPLEAQRVQRRKLSITERNATVLQHLRDYPNLEVLSISCIENLRSLPASIGSLRELRELVIDNGNGCAMNPVIPASIGQLRSLKKLVLNGAQDPRSAGEESLPLESSRRHTFPRAMSQLTNLEVLDLGRNGFEGIPDFVKDLPRLRELDFGWNVNVKTLPKFLTGLRELQILRLDSDGLQDLPDFLNEIPKLRRITLGDNCAITQNPAKRRNLQRRFPKIAFDFNDEYDCPEK